MIVLSIVVLSILGILFIFSNQKLSPVPYFPSNKKDLQQILESLHIENDQTIIDLGAGDGMIIFAAAEYAYKHKLDTEFVADEINPVLVAVLYIRRFFHPNKKNITIIMKDMFSLNIKNQISNIKSKHVTYYFYISPWLLEKAVNNIFKFDKKPDIISYMYEIPKMKPKKIWPGVHKTFRY